MSTKKNVVVIGYPPPSIPLNRSSISNTHLQRAGVVGLTTALTLLNRGTYNVTIVATFMPGDTDITYTSPLAGANWWPVSSPNTREADWDTQTFHELWRLAKHVPAAGVHVQNSLVYRRHKDQSTAITEWMEVLLSPNPWFKSLVEDFRELRPDELPKGVDAGTTFKSVCINVAIFLPWLLGLCLERGATVKRASLRHVCDAAGLHASGSADLVVNCTGLMARRLGGVMDEKVIPARGQIVVVRNEVPAMINISGTDDGSDESTYIMMRAAGASSFLIFWKPAS